MSKSFCPEKLFCTQHVKDFKHYTAGFFFPFVLITKTVLLYCEVNKIVMNLVYYAICVVVYHCVLSLACVCDREHPQKLFCDADFGKFDICVQRQAINNFHPLTKKFFFFFFFRKEYVLSSFTWIIINLHKIKFKKMH